MTSTQSEVQALAYDIRWLLDHCNTEMVRGCEIRDNTCSNYVEAQRLIKIMSQKKII